jgi:hypothetical protein
MPRENSNVRTMISVATIALTVLAAPTMVAAQDATSPDTEIERIQNRLMQTQERVLADEEVQAAQVEVGQVLVAAMIRLDPTLAGKTERAGTIGQDVAEAREARDNERLHELANEAEALQADLAAARLRALTEPDVMEAMEDFRMLVIDKMTEADPETPALITRLGELSDSGR